MPRPTVEPGKRRLRVITTQEAVDPERIRGSTVVVVDVLLATTTLIAILESGARRVFPAGSLEEAQRLCDTLEATTLVRGGEQDALMIDGYDCGPYPHEYSADVVSGKDVVFVSTNGTRAIARTATAGRLLVASLRNAPAVARHLEESGDESVFLVCAGSRGGFSLEDFAAAATIVSQVRPETWHFNDAAWLSRHLLTERGGVPRQLLENSRTGRWFVQNGMEDVLDYVGEVGASGVIGEMREGQLVAIGG